MTRSREFAESVINTMREPLISLDQDLRVVSASRSFYHDHLTGLPNRMLLIDRFNMAMRQAERNRTKVALMMLDLDKFKEVNDTLGHHVGDKLLQSVAKNMTGILRKGDTVGASAVMNLFSCFLSKKTPRMPWGLPEKSSRLSRTPLFLMNTH